MPLPRFEYLTAASLDEALGAWTACPDAVYFAGGTDLLPQMRAGRRHSPRLIDIKRVSALSRIRDPG